MPIICGLQHKDLLLVNQRAHIQRTLYIHVNTHTHAHTPKWFMNSHVENWWLVAQRHLKILIFLIHGYTHTRSPTVRIHLHDIHFHLQNLYQAPRLSAACFKSSSWFTADATCYCCCFFPPCDWWFTGLLLGCDISSSGSGSLLQDMA